ncbi:MAG: lysylphosphatidylglycerol synthase transmembrane domain-containing protein [Gaiellaceae bacterium]
MGEVLHAIRVFFEQLASVEFTALGLAILAHLLKTTCTSRAWRNAIAASYPEEAVPWRSIYASYLAGVGVNAIIPARAGDAVRLFLAHRAVPGSTYTTLASTLLVLSLFDSSMALLIFAYALTLGVLPGVGALGSLPGFEFGFFAANPEFSFVLLVALAIFGVIGFFWLRLHVAEFKHRVRQGLAVMADRTRYLREVALWQAGDWLLRFVAIWFFLDAFGIEQSIKNVLLVQVTQSLATLVPVSPGGIGTEQAFIVYVFKGTGVARATLLAFSVGMKLTLIVTNAILGFTALFLTLGHTDWRSLTGKQPASEP